MQAARVTARQRSDRGAHAHHNEQAANGAYFRPRRVTALLRFIQNFLGVERIRCKSWQDGYEQGWNDCLAEQQTKPPRVRFPDEAINTPSPFFTHR